MWPRLITFLLVVALSGPALAKKHHHDEDEDRFDCKERLQDRGDQRMSEDGAKGAAEKAWQQSVRFKYGELYADPVNARDKKYECVASSINGMLHRCELTAFPCRAKADHEHADK